MIKNINEEMLRILSNQIDVCCVLHIQKGIQNMGKYSLIFAKITVTGTNWKNMVPVS
jgi:hypothetical protein